MSTERFSLGINSLIPETYKTQVGAFAECLRHKLLSLSGVDSGASNSFNSESRKRLNNDHQIQDNCEPFTNPTLLYSFQSNFKPLQINSTPQNNKTVIDKNEKKNNGVPSNDEKSDNVEEEEFYSYSESETSDTSLEQKDVTSTETKKGKLYSMSSEDSTIESWCSCQDNFMDFDNNNSENEEANYSMIQTKNLPKTKYIFNLKEPRDRNIIDNKYENGIYINEGSYSTGNQINSFNLGSAFSPTDLLNSEEHKKQKSSSSETPSSNKKVFNVDEQTLEAKFTEKSSKNCNTSSTVSCASNFEKESENEESLDLAQNQLNKQLNEDVDPTENLEKKVSIKISEGGTNINHIETTNLSKDKKSTPEAIKETKLTNAAFSNGYTLKADDSKKLKCGEKNTNEDISEIEVKENFSIVNESSLETFNALNITESNDSTRNETYEDNYLINSPTNISKYLKRSSSLKTKKTPPGTPGAKKIVRFADALGLDLADVRTFLDEIPRIPNSAYEDLQYDFSSNTQSPVFQPLPSALLLVPLFQQPGLKMDFLEKVQQQKICLEIITMTDMSLLALSGYARVQNLDYHKSVYVRYSLNNWKTYSDLQATYVPNSCDGFSDKFTFVLYGHTLKIGEKLEFALRLECCGTQYWDSNGGINYAFNCLPEASANSFFPLMHNYDVQNQLKSNFDYY